MRVVGTLTTIPSRCDKILPTLVSIANQSYKLSAVYLNIPYSCARSDIDSDNYIIPTEYSDYCDIIRCQDYGPITKILGALVREQDPDTVIITFDDDCIYPEGLVEKLVSKHAQHSNCAIGSSGMKLGSFPFYTSIAYNEYKYNNKWYAFDIPINGAQVDILNGYSGVLYLRKFFPPLDKLDKLLRYPLEDDDFFKNDDVILSGYLSTKNIKRLVFKLPGIEQGESTSNSLNENLVKYVYSLIKAIYKARQEGMFKTGADYNRNRTMTYPAIAGLLIIILFSILLLFRRF